ncbi:MAG: hypothetical protein JO255_08495 [Alphaproteobacteria bacterium]|nr:hypothetical protein [Alphaproteobacteria bacterium]
MGGFLLLPKSSRPFRQGLLPAARDQFRKSGLDGRETVETDQFVFDHYKKSGAQGHNLVSLGTDAFIASIGTFIFAGRIGIEALQAFAAEPDPERALSAAYGHFVLIVRKGDEIRILRDRLGAHPIYLDTERQMATSSFLAAAGLAPKLTIADHEVYEYIFNGVTLGDTTPFREITRLPIGRSLRFAREIESIPQPGPALPAPAPVGFEESLSQSFDALSRYLKIASDLFGDNIRMALSGGYDSRLLFAVFRSLSCSPSLFVYGGKSDSDVVVAEKIVAGEGLSLRHVDKTQRRPTPDEIPDIVARNFHVEDALPWSGIMTSDAENRARLERSAGGALHVNGGGGEIFRNFFRLGDRPATAREFAWAFYCQIDPAACTPLFSRGLYVDTIVGKVAGVLPDHGRSLPRVAIESLYPNFRCRSWFGRENSINSRFGYSILPFYDHRIVEVGLRVPIPYKYVGNYEAALIRKASPRIAAYGTNYGHDFSTDAPLKRTLVERLSYVWPPYLRQYHHALKARLRGNLAAPRILQPDILRTLIDPSLPYMSRFVRLGRIRSLAQLERVYSLEYVFQKLNPGDR